LGCSDHAGESVPPDPMRTGSSRVAHGSKARHGVRTKLCTGRAEGGEQDTLIGIQTRGGTILRGATVPPSPGNLAGREGTTRTPGTGQERFPPSTVRNDTLRSFLSRSPKLAYTQFKGPSTVCQLYMVKCLMHSFLQRLLLSSRTCCSCKAEEVHHSDLD
jgi:hypothetical protein